MKGRCCTKAAHNNVIQCIICYPGRNQISAWLDRHNQRSKRKGAAETQQREREPARPRSAHCDTIAYGAVEALPTTQPSHSTGCQCKSLKEALGWSTMHEAAALKREHGGQSVQSLSPHPGRKPGRRSGCLVCQNHSAWRQHGRRSANRATDAVPPHRGEPEDRRHLDETAGPLMETCRPSSRGWVHASTPGTRSIAGRHRDRGDGRDHRPRLNLDGRFFPAWSGRRAVNYS